MTSENEDRSRELSAQLICCSAKPNTHQCTDLNQSGVLKYEVDKASRAAWYYLKPLSAGPNFIKPFNPNIQSFACC